MAAAIPFAIKAGTLLGGSLLGKKLSGASGQQKQAMAGQQGAADALNSYGKPLMSGGMQLANQGSGYLQGAGNYYSDILSNRRSARESLAPEMKGALDFYKGAETKTKRTMVGGARDNALAELDRGKVGNMAMMLPQARRYAAEGALGAGGTALNAGAQMTGQGGGLFSDAARIQSGMFNQATTVRNQEGEGGKAWGGLLYDVAQKLPWGKMGGGGASTGSVPTYTPGSVTSW